MYMSETKALKIFESCLNELYLNSDPPISWEKVGRKYGDKPRSEFYMKHKISEEKYEKIVEKYKKKLTPYYRRQLSWTLLDYAPTTVEME